jgi:hypothetical protein
MSNDDDALYALAWVLFILWILVAVAALAVVWAALVFVYRQLTGRVTSESNGPPVSMFGAPASSWWVENYERWLWRLEDITGVNFSSSPERLFAGSMLLAVCVGLPIALLAGISAAAVLGEAGFVTVGGLVFISVVLVNGLSAWGLSRPVAGWWTPVSSGDELAPLPSEEGGFILGQLIDEE